MQREHCKALGGPIYQLEAQLVAHVNAPIHEVGPVNQSLVASKPYFFKWQSPPLHLNLETTTPASFTADHLDFGSFSPGTNMPPTFSPIRFATISQHLLASKPIESPTGPHNKLSGEFQTQASANQLKHGTASSQRRLRRTSASSLSLESDDQAMLPILEVEDDLLLLGPAPRLPRQGTFAPNQNPTAASSRSNFTDRSRAIATIPLPSRFEAETLTTEFIQYIGTLNYRAYSISLPLFARFFEFVYPNQQKASSAIDVSVSMSMARFHVFLAMAVAMKLRIRDSPESTNALLDTCYELAMQQASTSTFWQESGNTEAAQLLSVFAWIRETPSNERSPVHQHSPVKIDFASHHYN